MRPWMLMALALTIPSWVSAQVEDVALDTTGVAACAPLDTAPSSWPTFRPVDAPISFRAPSAFQHQAPSRDEVQPLQSWSDQQGGSITVTGTIKPPAEAPLDEFRSALPPREGGGVRYGCNDCFSGPVCIQRLDEQWFMLMEGGDGWGMSKGVGIALSASGGWTVIWITGPTRASITLGRQVASTLQLQR